MKRWTTAITSSFDYVMSQVENHDALVSAAIREMQVSGARARGQLSRVRRDGERMIQREKELQELIAVWSERAIRASAESEEKALECLKRKRQAVKEREQLARHIEEHTRVEQQLTKDLRTIDERVSELKRKKNTMNARQYRAEALRAGQLSELGLIGEIDEIFDRWQSQIGEYDGECAERDPLAEEFSNDEELQSLRAELSTLRSRS